LRAVGGDLGPLSRRGVGGHVDGRPDARAGGIRRQTAPGVAGRSSTTRPTPAAASAVTSTVVPRSLNEPVGFRYSHLKKRGRSPQRAFTSGVSPSPRVTGGASGGSGRACR
jgi:hypothetical protein